MKNPKDIAKGKKTFAMIGGVLASTVAGYAASKGYNIGFMTPDLAYLFAGAFGAAALWARSVAQPAVVVTDTRASKTSGPKFS